MYLVRALCVVGFVFPAALATGEDTPPAAVNTPRLHCDEPVRDFGVVTNVRQLAHTFVLRNTGSAALNISKVHAPCGCTTASLKTKTIVPGASVDLAATLSLKKVRGRKRKNIHIHSDDPAAPRYTLGLACEVKRDVYCEPAHLYVGDAVAGTNPVTSVTLRSDTGSVFSPTRAVVSPSNGLRAVIVSPGPGPRHTVQLFLEPGHEQTGTRVSTTLKIWTDHPAVKYLAVPVKLYFKPRFAVSPRQMVVPKSDGTKFTRYILVHSPRNENFTLFRIETPSEDIRIEEQRLSDTRHRIVLRDLGHDPALNGREFVMHIRAVDGTVTQLRVPIIMQ